MTEHDVLRSAKVRLQDSDGRTLPIPDLQLTGDRIGLVGPWEPLFRLLGGEYTLASGTLSVGGVGLPQDLGRGRLGVALRPCAWPRRWTVLDYLTMSAELAGIGRREARAAGESALTRLGLGRLNRMRLASLSEPEARSVKLGEALITDPTTLVVESPLDELDSAAEYWMLEALRRASLGRRLIASFRDWPATVPGHSLLHSMEGIIELHHELAGVRTLGAGTIPTRRRYRLVVAEPGGVLADELRQHGWSLIERPSGPSCAAPFVSRPSAIEWIAELPPEENTESHVERLLELARSCGTPVLEFVPMRGPSDGAAASRWVQPSASS